MWILNHLICLYCLFLAVTDSWTQIKVWHFVIFLILLVTVKNVFSIFLRGTSGLFDNFIRCCPGGVWLAILWRVLLVLWRAVCCWVLLLLATGFWDSTDDVCNFYLGDCLWIASKQLSWTLSFVQRSPTLFSPFDLSAIWNLLIKSKFLISTIIFFLE